MSPKKINQIISVGASITNSPWWTWKDYLQIESKIKNINLAVPGAGNEFMIHNLVLNKDKLNENTLVVVMFTNIDKFDWFISKEKFSELKKEKNKAFAFGKDNGFWWCTGSWFPKEKEIFKDIFYSEDYFIVKTIQQLLLLNELKRIYKFELVVAFDSPIWTYIEQEINQIANDITGYNKKENNLLTNPLSKIWKDLIEVEFLDIADKSLIGYCIKNNLPWQNEFYGPHPSPISHYKWYKDILVPELLKFVDLDLSLDYTDKLESMEKIWKKEY